MPSQLRIEPLQSTPPLLGGRWEALQRARPLAPRVERSEELVARRATSEGAAAEGPPGLKAPEALRTASDPSREAQELAAWEPQASCGPPKAALVPWARAEGQLR